MSTIPSVCGIICLTAVNDPLDLELSGPTLVESYRDFTPPSNFRGDVETLLRYVPPKYLVGLKTIVLTNRAGLTRSKRKQRVWSRNRMVRLADSLGSYSRASRSSPATVWLYVDNICRQQAEWFRWIPLLRYAVSADVLYHEIGHHIHTVHRRVHDGRENVAEDWSRKLSGHFWRKHYWYLLPLLYPLARVASPVSKWLRRAKKTRDGANR
jgi:hypothetical protein